ncbi:hypothetical protein CRG98_006604 [Punica granatum]|uniref:Uncharacterized protein n=1 Tax=Punica granatum TaxID=22663 RepID=A0A2I0KWZ5_PUNGR|nr:hypothetical protein CRG98_006604 [Punica granatum]
MIQREDLKGKRERNADAVNVQREERELRLEKSGKCTKGCFSLVVVAVGVVGGEVGEGAPIGPKESGAGADVEEDDGIAGADVGVDGLADGKGELIGGVDSNADLEADTGTGGSGRGCGGVAGGGGVMDFHQ